MRNILTTLEISAIKLYQTTKSKFSTVSCCRHYPTCSEYAVQVLSKYGFIKGNIKAFVRVLKCNQYFPGGFDPA